MTDQQKQRIESELTQVADSPVTVEKVTENFYYFCGTELGMYRIVNHYKSMFDKLSYGFSKNMNTWYVSKAA